MRITRITAQKDERLADYYAREANWYREHDKSTFADMLSTMVDLLDYLTTSVDGPSVYAVTSHFRLRLISGDDYTLPTLATVEAVIDGPNTFGFEIAYEMPQKDAPWNNAWVRGLAFDVPQAAEMILIALHRNANAW